MPVDLESCEQEYENEQRAHRREWRGRVLPHDRPPRERPRSRPPFPRWKVAAVPDDFNRFWRKRPCPYPLTPNPRALAELTARCEGQTELLQRRHVARFRPALLAVSAHRRDWLRPLPSWDPPGGGPGRQFESLLRHLFALYDVPRFLDAAWLEGLTPDGVTYQGWYKHVGRRSEHPDRQGATRPPHEADGAPVPPRPRRPEHPGGVPVYPGPQPGGRRTPRPLPAGHPDRDPVPRRPVLGLGRPLVRSRTPNWTRSTTDLLSTTCTTRSTSRPSTRRAACGVSRVSPSSSRPARTFQ